MTVLVKVYLLDSTLAFDRLYTYLADEAALVDEGVLRRGMFVVVPFGRGNKEREALVWEVDREGAAEGNAVDGAALSGKISGKLPGKLSGETSGTVSGKKKIVLKQVKRAYEDEPLSEDEIELCRGLTKLYACTPGTAVRCIRPFRENKKALSRKTETVELSVGREEAVKLVSETGLRSIYQIRILEALSEEGASGTEDLERLLLKTDAKRIHVKALEKKGLVRLGERDAGAEDIAAYATGRSPGGKAAELLPTYAEHVLNEEQEAAFSAVRASLDSGARGRFLLHGITGSGKTEVYMHLISYVLEKGGSVIVMVPEISLTPQMISHFTARFGDSVAVWHSALGDAVREREWYRMKKGIARVLVATRSGIFAPLPDVRLVIIDEAHDSSYRSEETGLRYDTCEVAELRFGKSASLLLGSATPDVCTYHRALDGEMQLLRLTRRAGAGQLPKMEIIDMRDERSALAQGHIFSGTMKKALSDNYSRGCQAMLFVGRRGYSSRMYCRECGRSMICSFCGLPMTFHSGARRLLCNYCGRTAPAPESCPACGSKVLGFGSPGTERVEQELKKLFPEAEVLRMDSDTVRGRDGHGAILKKFRKDNVPFLVGTQMITKGHDFPDVGLVCVVDADGQINRPEYDAGEKAFQIISQVAGRAGRSSAGGLVAVQTYNVDDGSLKAASEGDYEAFYEKEIRFRKAMIYPPFCSLGSIRVSGVDDKAVYTYLNGLAAAMREDAGGDPGTAVLGPSREPVPRIAGRYRWQLTVKAEKRDKIIDLFLKNYDKMKPGAGMRLATVFEN